MIPSANSQRRKNLSVELLEGRYALTGIGFAPQDIPWNIDGEFSSNGFIRDLEAIDVDDDGDIDVLAASSTEIAWYANVDGRGLFGEPEVLDTFTERSVVDSIDSGDVGWGWRCRCDCELTWKLDWLVRK